MSINDKQDRLLKRLSRELKLKLVVLYGSKAGGVINQESDLDLAVMAETKPDLRLFNRLYRAFCEIFPGEALDVRFLNSADPLFLMQVVKNGCLLAGSETEFIELKIQANRRYIDDGRKYFSYQDQLIKRQQEYLSRASL
ncbi:MAG: nucleotidyltransferase domain-containing protein [Patescibacteria group bacterium]|nr:nucleotidyltransferase domain-containing protein [Patescibacteria group bacterium]